MDHFEGKLAKLANIAKSRELTWNLVAWGTYLHKPFKIITKDTEGYAVFSLAGNAPLIVNLGFSKDIFWIYFLNIND
jgi:hypothetical protein